MNRIDAIELGPSGGRVKLVWRGLISLRIYGSAPNCVRSGHAVGAHAGTPLHPPALNDHPGTYRIRVRDVLSGVSATAKTTVL